MLIFLFNFGVYCLKNYHFKIYSLYYKEKISTILLFLVQSVHFDDVHDLTHNLESSPTKTVQQVVELVRNSRQRSLNEWYFAEHFEPKILVQVCKI